VLDAYPLISCKIPNLFKKACFRPAARGIGCHTANPATQFRSASWVYLEDAGRRRLAVKPGTRVIC
jgi:hypothetical protein